MMINRGIIGSVLGVLALSLVFVEARPPVKSESVSTGDGHDDKAPNVNVSDMELGLEYNRYLQEVVQILESDPDFRKKLESVDAEKIKDGSIARELEMVGHHVRSQLDDVKRRELDRLRNAAMRQYELNMGLDRKHIVAPDHLKIDSARFEVEDLKRLIQSTTRDLEAADRKRADDFKRYEMEKKFENESRLRHIEKEDDREKELTKINESKERHKKHEKVNHPMTKDQLEEVWEEQDHMKAEDWDPKTFFAMHDLNGDRQWDENELKVLFRKELDKVYDPNNRDDDMKEREEEMERMREHVFKESDKDKNRLISFEEFMAETMREEYNKDPGWDTIDEREQDVFSDNEYNQYKLDRQREMDMLMEKGLLPPEYPFFGEIPPGAVPLSHVPPGYHPPPHPQQFGSPYPAPHPGQFQPGPPPQGHAPNMPIHQGVPLNQQGQPIHHNMPNNAGNVPQQQFQQPNNPGQVPQQQQQFHQPNNPGQVPQQQQQFQQPNNPGQVPQQQFQQPNNPGQVPQQQFQQPNNPGQVPQQQQQQQQFQQPNNPGQVPQQQFQGQPNSGQGVKVDISNDKAYNQPQPRGNPPIRSQGPTGSRGINDNNIPNQANSQQQQQQQPNQDQQYQNRP